MATLTKYKQFVLALLIVLGGASFFLIDTQPAVAQSSSGMMYGYAWSETVGWLALADDNTGDAINYGMSVNSSGQLSGYAWSENIGWVSANASDLSGCPQSPCTARFQTGKLLGWFKAINAADGWDGWIALGDTDTNDANVYGVTVIGRNLSGYGWGETVVGWLDFQYASTSYAACVPGNVCLDPDTSYQQDAACNAPVTDTCSSHGSTWYCSASNGLCTPPPPPSFTPGDELEINPSLIIPGQTAVVSWNVQNAISCTVTEDNPNFSDSWTTMTGNETTSVLTETTTYYLTCESDGGTLEAEATVSILPSWQEL